MTMTTDWPMPVGVYRRCDVEAFIEAEHRVKHPIYDGEDCDRPGISRYTKRGCRCPGCRAAKADIAYRHRERKKHGSA